MASTEISNHYVRLYGLEKDLSPSKKPKLVFLHGLLGNSQNWASLSKSFEEDYEVLTYDLRGHGRTPVFNTKGFEPHAFAQDLVELLNALSWKKVNAVGHSLGGRILMSACSLYPEYFEKIVIEDMGPHKTGTSSEDTKSMITSVPTPFSSREEAKAFFKNSFEPTYGKVMSDYLYGNLVKKDSGQMDWRFDKEGALACIKIGQEKEFWTEYKSIKSKHLILRGESSNHLPAEVLAQMLEVNSQAEAVEISGAGHWVHFDQRDPFVEELKRFLKN